MYIERMSQKNCVYLMRAGIVTDAQLAQMSYQELLKVRNIGHVAIEEVNQKVRIPMGLEPLERPQVKEIHPNRKKGIDDYWERYRRGEVKSNKYRRS